MSFTTYDAGDVLCCVKWLRWHARWRLYQIIVSTTSNRLVLVGIRQGKVLSYLPNHVCEFAGWMLSRLSSVGFVGEFHPYGKPRTYLRRFVGFGATSSLSGSAAGRSGAGATSSARKSIVLSALTAAFLQIGHGDEIAWPGMNITPAFIMFDLQVTGSEGLGLAALGHRNCLPAKFLEEELHRAACASV